MTDTEKIGLEKDVLWEHHKAQQDLNAQAVKVERMADKLEELSKGLRSHPELVTGTPAPGSPDYREALDVLNRQELLTACKELADLKEKVRTTQRRVTMLEVGSQQSRVD